MANEPNGKVVEIPPFRTSLSNQTRRFSWEIENVFPLWPQDVIKDTPNFFPEPDLTFYATLKIEYGSQERERLFHLSFHLKEGYDIRIFHHTKLTNSVGKVLHEFASMSHMYQDGTKECKLKPFPLTKLLPNTGVLILKWTMVFVRFTETEPCIHMPRPASENLLNLTSELKEMYIKAENADTTLKVGDINVPVHKCIMSKRSPVFAKMFEANKIEYEIPDSKPQILQCLIEFLYCATLNDDSFESVHDLYHAADMFQVDDLKATCISVLLSKLDVGNACQELVLAHDHQDNDFKKSVMDFILSHFTEIVTTTVWRQFVKDHTILAAEVMEIHFSV